MVIFDELMFWFKFYMDLSVFSCLETFRQTLGLNLGIGKSKLGFWVKNGEKPVRTGGNLLEVLLWRVLSGRNSLMAKNSLTAIYSVTTFPVSRSRVFFAHFGFDLAFGVNMKVLDNCVSFPVALV